MMKNRQLGNSGLWISEIGIGSWLTYGTGIEKETSFNCLKTALDSGINFIDTADVYNRGEAEKVIGEFLKTIRREEVVIGTKVFGPMSDHWMTQGLSLRHIRNACEASLQRLRTDYIDLYQCHRYDPETPLEEICYAMHNLIERGYILHWGVSQWSAIQIINAIRVCEKNGWRKPVSNQPIYNMLNRSLEVDVMGVCESENLGIVVYSPLAQGLLSGKYAENFFPENSRAADEKMGKNFPLKRMTPEFFGKMEKLKEIVAELGITVSQLALAWNLSRKPLTSVITGASNPLQVSENVKAAEVKLAQDVLDRIEDILDNAPVDQYSGERIGYGIVKKGY